MRSISIISLLLIAGLSVFGQDSIRLKTDPFHSLKVSDKMKIQLVPSDEPGVVLYFAGVEKKKVNAELKDGELKLNVKGIGTKVDSIWGTVYYDGMLDEISVFNGAQVRCDSVIQREALKLVAETDGYMRMEIEVKRLDADMSAGGKATVRGTANYQEVSVNSGGKFNAYNLISEYADVKVLAGGVAEVQATEKLSGSVTAGGEIKYVGDPRIQSVSTTLGGKITRIAK